jgi:hypothetical protein
MHRFTMKNVLASYPFVSLVLCTYLVTSRYISRLLLVLYFDPNIPFLTPAHGLNSILDTESTRYFKSKYINSLRRLVFVKCNTLLD